MTNLYDVTVQHPAGHKISRRIAAPSEDLVREDCAAVGLEVLEIHPVGDTTEAQTSDPVDMEPTPTGRLYGQPSKGKRRTKAEIEQDDAIEAAAEELGVDLSEVSISVADDLEAWLKEQLAEAAK